MESDWLAEIIYNNPANNNGMNLCKKLADEIRTEIRRRRPKESTPEMLLAAMLRNKTLADYDKALGLE